MLKSIHGVYKSGKIELEKRPADVYDDTPVIVTFLEAGRVDLRAHGIGASAAADLRAHLATFAEDWNSPEMDIYDHYEDVKSDL
ncbi:MAG: hypothetical protein U9Q82_10910 [Chloroflexota bacterium]|nr:hypothetical protein [Chloroflexota bacterium]